MNCECIYYNSTKTLRGYKEVAKYIEGLEGEIYPVAISRIVSPVKVALTYDDANYCEDFNSVLPEDSLVLFVQGKLHYMDDIELPGKERRGERLIKVWFPERSIQFEDIITFEEE